MLIGHRAQSFEWYCFHWPISYRIFFKFSKLEKPLKTNKCLKAIESVTVCILHIVVFMKFLFGKHVVQFHEAALKLLHRRMMICKRGLSRHAVSVCLCVRVSVTFMDSDKTNKHIFTFFSLSGSHDILVFPYQTSWWYYNENPLAGPSTAGGVGRNSDSEPISGFITSCQLCDRLLVINTVPPDHGKLWHLTLVVSGGVCWWRETTTKCLWQKPQCYAEDNRTAFNCMRW